MSRYTDEEKARPRCTCDHDQNGQPGAPGGRCCQCGKLARRGTIMAMVYVDEPDTAFAKEFRGEA